MENKKIFRNVLTKVYKKLIIAIVERHKKFLKIEYG